MISGATGATVGAPSTHTVTIVDGDDAPTVSFVGTDSNVNEGSGGGATLQLSGPSASDVTVTYGAVGGTATSPADYSITTPLTVTISAGSTTTPVTLTTVADGLFEGNETVPLVISGATGATVGAPSTHTITIVDGDSAPTVQFQLSSSSESESAGTVNLTVVLSGPSALPISVEFAATAGTADDPDDYGFVGASPLNFAPGTTISSVDVAIVDDAVFEGDETVEVTLSSPMNAVLGATNPHTLTIVDDEGRPEIRFTAANQTVSETDGTVTVTAELSALSSEEVTVTVSLGGTAITPDDYGYITLTFTIPAGSLQDSINLSLLDDAIYEGDETIIVTMGVPVNAVLGSPSEQTITIQDDESVPTVQFLTAGQLASEGGGPVLATVVLSGESAFDVTVPFTTDGTALNPVDYNTSLSPVTIAAGSLQSDITVTPVNDALDEFDETAILILGVPDGAGLGFQDTHTVTIQDDDEEPTVSFAIASSSVAESAGTINLVALLSDPSGKEVTVPFTVSDITTTVGDDYSVLTGPPLVFAPGDTAANISVSIVSDAIFELDEDFIGTLMNPVNASLGATPSHTVTITNDDAQPTVSFVVSEQNVEETAGTATVLLQLSEPSPVPVTVSFSTGGTANDPADYNFVTPSPITFPAGDTEFGILLNIIDDDINEGLLTVVMTLTSADGATLGAIIQNTLSILDDDPARFPGESCDETPVQACSSVDWAKINVKDHSSLGFEWRGFLSPSVLGHPEEDTAHVMCIYRDGELLTQHQVKPGAGWTEGDDNETTFKGKYGVSDGVREMRFQADYDNGKGHVYTNKQVLPDLPISPQENVTVQLLNQAEMCLQAVFQAPLETDTSGRAISECDLNCGNPQDEEDYFPDE